MIEYYILSLNVQSTSEWDRCTLRNPITGERPDLIAKIAKAVSDRGGSYLIKVNLEVEVLQQNAVDLDNTVELTTAPKQPRLVG